MTKSLSIESINASEDLGKISEVIQMKQERPVKKIDVGTPFAVIIHMTMRSITVAVMGGTGIAAVALLRLPNPLMLPIAILCGWYIFYAAYQIMDRSSKQKYYLVTRWNHLLLVMACLIGGIWGGMLYSGICIIPNWSTIDWAPFSLTNCGDMFSIIKRFLSASAVCSIFLLFVPIARAYFYWCR